MAYITINQQYAAVRSQFYFTAGLLYMFRVLSTPIIRSTLNCITASGTGHIIVAATFFRRGQLSWPLRPRRRCCRPVAGNIVGELYHKL